MGDKVDVEILNLKKDVDIVRNELEIYRKDTQDTFENLREKIAKKVSTQCFYWVLGLLTSINLVFFGVMLSAQNDIKEQQSSLQVIVAEMSGKIDERHETLTILKEVLINK